MLPYYDPNYIFFPTIVIFMAGVIIMSSYNRNIALSIVISLIKASLFFIYFYYLFTNGYTFSDDWDYLNESNVVVNYGEDFLSLISKPTEMEDIFKNRHYIYHLYNILSFEFFGKYYFSPVALNIILTFITSYFLYKISNLIFSSIEVSIIISTFFLLQWDLITWGTMLNIKDILIQLLVTIFTFNLMRLTIKFSLIDIISIISIITILNYLRFYLIYILLMGYLLYFFILYFIKFPKSIKITITVVAILIILFISLYIVPNFFSYEFNILKSSLSNPIFGAFRFIVTPYAFGMDKYHTFLIPASFLHWLALPFLLYGVYITYTINRKRALLIFSILAIVLLFFGSYSVQQGPRHRLQILEFMAIFQVVGFLTFFYKDRFITSCKIEKSF